MKLIEDRHDLPGGTWAHDRELFGSLMGAGFHRIEFTSLEILRIHQYLSSGSEVRANEVKCVFEQLMTRILPPMPKVEDLTDATNDGD